MPTGYREDGVGARRSDALQPVVCALNFFALPPLLQVPTDGQCMTRFMAEIATSHAALGVPWRFFLPAHVLEPRGALVLRLNTRHRKPTETSLLKYIANVRYTVAVDVHHPIVMAPFACLDEGEMRRR